MQEILNKTSQVIYKILYEVNWFKQKYYGNLVSPVDADITTYTDWGISIQFYLPNHGSDLLTDD
jgi:hypothetical protein